MQCMFFYILLAFAVKPMTDIEVAAAKTHCKIAINDTESKYRQTNFDFEELMKDEGALKQYLEIINKQIALLTQEAGILRDLLKKDLIDEKKFKSLMESLYLEKQNLLVMLEELSNSPRRDIVKVI